MKCVFIISLFSLMASTIYAQKEAAHWFFGHGYGLNLLDTQAINEANGVPVEGIQKNESSPLHTNEG